MVMAYKGYRAKIEFDDEAGIFHGEVINVRDVITFQGTSVAELRKSLRDSVEDHFAFCRERNEVPAIGAAQDQSADLDRLLFRKWLNIGRDPLIWSLKCRIVNPNRLEEPFRPRIGPFRFKYHGIALAPDADVLCCKAE